MSEKKKIIITATATFLATSVLVSALFMFFSPNRLNSVNRIIEKYYIGEYDSEKLEDYAAKGAVASLGDEHSYYMTQDELTAIMADITGSYKGIGVEVYLNEAGMIEISSVFASTPAYAAGLVSGDIITGVDSLNASADNYYDVISYMRGTSEEGAAQETMTLHVLRGTEAIDVPISRSDIERQTIFTQDIGSLRYIRITAFTETTVSEFASAINDLSGVSGLIFDVRDNPGGYLDSVTEMADMLLPECTVVCTKDKAGRTEYYKSDADCVKLPMAVLVNENSASASEILSAALKDNGAAKLIGTKTYGKGSVQSVFPLNRGCAVKLTIAYYYTPADVCINGIGITPDFEVELSEAYSNVPLSNLTFEQDSQLQKAVELLK